MMPESRRGLTPKALQVSGRPVVDVTINLHDNTVTVVCSEPVYFELRDRRSCQWEPEHRDQNREGSFHEPSTSETHLYDAGNCQMSIEVTKGRFQKRAESIGTNHDSFNTAQDYLEDRISHHYRVHSKHTKDAAKVEEYNLLKGHMSPGYERTSASSRLRVPESRSPITRWTAVPSARWL